MRRLIAAAAVILATASCSVSSSAATAPRTGGPDATLAAAATTPGCTLPNLSIDLTDAKDDGAPYAGRTVPRYPPILSTGRSVTSVAGSDLASADLKLPSHLPNGLPLVALVSHGGVVAGAESDPASVGAYYSSAPIKQTDTFLDVIGHSGAIFIASSTTGTGAQRVVDTVGQRANVIQVGPYQAALTHSSTYPNGVRTYNLYWSDGTLDYSLIVNGSAAEAIQTAQSLYCS